MKFLIKTYISIVLLAVCLPMGMPMKTQAQSFGYKPSKNDPKYKLSDVNFQYPARYSPKKIEEGKTIFFLREQDKESLFVSLLNNPIDLKKEMELLREKLLAALLTGDNTNFKWKQVFRQPDKAGKYDVKQEKWKAFDGNNLFFFEYHHLKVRNKDILVGYAFVMERESSSMAEYIFNKDMDAGSGSAGAGSSTIIASITGEGDISIGMPPPAAGPPPVKN